MNYFIILLIDCQVATKGYLCLHFWSLNLRSEAINIIKKFSSVAVKFSHSLDICTLLNLDQNFLKFYSEFFKQNQVFAMGSNISLLLVERFMKHVETFLSVFRYYYMIMCWYRYVDDCFVVFKWTVEELREF